MPEGKSIVVVGSINMDIVAKVARIPSPGETVLGGDLDYHPGGKGANQAVAVARLGHPVKLIGRVGSDGFAAQLKASLVDAGVDASKVVPTDGPSGIALILVSENGENCIVVTPGANASLSPQDIDRNIATIREAGAVLAQLEIPIETVCRLAEVCAAEGIPLILDPAPAANLPASLLRQVSWFTPNETEAAFYLARANASSDSIVPEDRARALRQTGANGIILKLGSRGVFVSVDGHERFVPAFPVQALDSTAAGDAFNGAFATALMRGNDPWESGRFAAAAAAISVTRAGAQSAMPSLAEVEEFLRTAGETTAPA